MKQLLRKEWREQFKMALLGLGIFTLFLVLICATELASPRKIVLSGNGSMYYGGMLQPLLSPDIQGLAMIFCAIFGTLLGWLQIGEEKPPDLRAFLLHRPAPRGRMLRAKLLAGAALYALAAGLPLLGLVAYVVVPGYVAAPFEWAMVLPLVNIFLAGLVFYGTGLLTGLRQARWYGSRTFGVGLAIIGAVTVMTAREFWQGFLFLLVTGVIMLLAVAGSFQTGGFYRNQRMPGKLALSIACAGGGLVLCALAALIFASLLENRPIYYNSRYAITRAGAVYQVTEGGSRPPVVVDLAGKPLLDQGTGKAIGREPFNQLLAPALGATVDFQDAPQPRAYYDRYNSNRRFFLPMQTADKTLWYWTRAGCLVGYDGLTGRKTGELTAGAGGQFAAPENNNNYFGTYAQPAMLRAGQTVYRVDLEGEGLPVPVFRATNGEALGGYAADGHSGEVLVLTRNAIRLLDRKGDTELVAPFTPGWPQYPQVVVWRLGATNGFAVETRPDYKLKGKLPGELAWMTAGSAVLRHQELPPLPQPDYKNVAGDYASLVFPPALRLPLEYYDAARFTSNGWDVRYRPDRWDALSAIPAVLCAAVGWVLGRRYHFTAGRQAGWVVFHLIFGLAGLLGFLSVQEWPAREICPGCRKPRLVDREKCEHCGAPFAAPPRNGTEIFEEAVPAQALV